VNIPVNSVVKAYGRVLKFDDTRIFFDTLGYEFGPNGSLTSTYSNTIVHPQVSIAGWSVKPYGFLGPVQEYMLNGVTHNKPTIGFAPVPSHACWAIWAG
jgi:hypothetical protein